MDLLPQHHREFGQTEYWDSFFKKRGKKAFEWYGEYGELCGVLHKYIKPQEHVLIVGCGNSTLSADLYDVGYRHLISIDLSEVVIRQMNENKRLHNRGDDLVYETMDVTSMPSFSDCRFGVVLDKGTLDAMFVDESDQVIEKIDAMFKEIDRVLKVGGRYVCISLLQPHIVRYIVDYFSTKLGWPLRILRCKEVDDAKQRPEDRVFPVFVVIATKFRKISTSSMLLLELGMSIDGKLTRFQRTEELVESIRGVQQFAAIRANRGNEEVSLDLRSPGSDKPRYSIFLVDRSEEIRVNTVKFAVFIVPQGRENEWLFVTAEGRRQLAESASCSRMLVVHLHREHDYDSLDKVKSELSGYATEFAPGDLSSDYRIPFLSLGNEDVGRRSVRCQGRSEFSGEFVVEDVFVGEKDVFRRLIFLSNPNLTQSEGKKKTKQIVDQTYLACTHHSVMIGAVGLFTEKARCLVIGLGGGALASHLSHNFTQLESVDVVELDPAIVRIAQDQFGFEPNQRLKVITTDGIDFINNCTDKYSLLMIDVDSKDGSVGMSCPPKQFVTKQFLQSIRKCLSSDGIFVLNLVCRDPVLRGQVIQDLKSEFINVLTYKVPEEVNEICFCDFFSDAKPRKRLLDSFRRVNAILHDDAFLDMKESESRICLS